MMKSINSFFLFISLLVSTINAQTISSKVVDNATNQPLEYATVAIKNTGKGVITNQDGNFRLKVQDGNNSIIIISYLGYQTIELKSDQIPPVIQMKEDTKTLQTITVSAETATAILKKAFKNIEKNYPQQITKQFAFYRENCLTEKEDFIYVSEGAVEIVKNKYNKISKNDFGQLKILKGRTNFINHIDWASKTSFYGGHLYWSRYDMVKKRMEFINPKHFNKYHYQLSEPSIQDGKLVYVISFDAENGELSGIWNGNIYIESDTYAYVGADISANDLGIKKRNRKDGHINHQWRKYSFEIRYKKTQKHWHLNNLNYYSTIIRDGFKEVQFKDEFVVTETIVEHVKPIAFEDRLDFNTSFSHQVFNEFDSTFFAGHAILEESEHLKKEIEPIVIRQKEINLSKEEAMQVKVNTTKGNIRNRFSFSAGLTSLPLGIENANYRFISQNNSLVIVPNERFSGVNRTNGIYWNINYDLSKRWTFGTSFFHSLNRFIQYDFYDINLRYNFLLKKIGRPLIVQPQIAYWFGKAHLQFENPDVSEILRIDDRNFDTDQINLSIGKRFSAIKSSLNFIYQFSPVVGLQAGIDYYFPFLERSRVFVRDNSSDNNSFIRPISYPIENDNFLIEKNGQVINNDFPIGLEDWSFRLGIVIDF